MGIYKRPLEQSPSKTLIENISNVKILNAPIADIACGYGRNGAYFVDRGYEVIFVDMDEDGLSFINNGMGVSEKGDIDLSHVMTLKCDLETEDWPFKNNSLGGIINVHYYNRILIAEFIRSLCRGGFLYIETVDARGHNYLELPERGFIVNAIKGGFNVLYCKEKLAKPYEIGVATIKLLAVKCV